MNNIIRSLIESGIEVNKLEGSAGIFIFCIDNEVSVSGITFPAYSAVAVEITTEITPGEVGVVKRLDNGEIEGRIFSNHIKNGNDQYLLLGKAISFIDFDKELAIMYRDGKWLDTSDKFKVMTNGC